MSVSLQTVLLTRLAEAPKHTTENELCLTPACVHAASELLYNLSPDYQQLDPCNDFEELVCGGWKDRHDLRPDQGDAFTGTIMSENSQLLLRHILEAPYPEDSSVSFCTLVNEHQLTIYSIHSSRPCVLARPPALQTKKTSTR